MNIADAAADADAGGYPQLSGEYIVSREPRTHRPRRHEVLRADRRDGGEAARLGADRRRSPNGDIVEADDDIASRWGPRTVDFVELIAAIARGDRSGRSDERRRPAGSRPGRERALPGVSLRWAAAAGVFLVVAIAARPRARARSTSASSRSPARCSATCRFSASSRRSRPPRTRSSGSSGRPGWRSGSSSARCSPRRGRPTRASSGTRSPTRTCSALRRAPGSARRSSSPTTSAATAGLDLRPVAAFVGATLGVGGRLPPRPLGGWARDGDAHPRRGHGRRLLHRRPDLHPAAQRGDRAGGVQLDPRASSRRRAGRDVLILLPYVVVSTVVLLWHRRLLDVLAVGDDEAASLGVPVGPRAAAHRGRGDARDGGRGRVQRPDRVRRASSCRTRSG